MRLFQHVAAFPDLEAADVRAVISRYRLRHDWDRNFAVVGNFKRIDPDSRPDAPPLSIGFFAFLAKSLENARHR